MEKQKGTMHPSRRDGVYRRLLGHLWTVGPAVREIVSPTRGPEARPWRSSVPNEFGDDIIYSGLFSEGKGDNDTLVVILHGLGGDPERGYCGRAAAAARRVGYPSLRLALRGADGYGKDLHHAGFTDDLGPLLAKAPCNRYTKIVLVGYSLGGHVALKAAVDGVDERLEAVVSLCAPLDLKACQAAIDAPKNWVYRQYLLRGLKASYPKIARGGRGPTPVDRIDDVETLREWDSLTVVPRFGFQDVDHYYQTQSVGQRLDEIRIPTLVVASPADPMVPAASLRGPLGRAPDNINVRWVRDGGHVFFPPKIRMGFGPEPGVEQQVMAWIGRPG